MALQQLQDAVKEAQSVDVPSSTDVPVDTTIRTTSGSDEETRESSSIRKSDDQAPYNHTKNFSDHLSGEDATSKSTHARDESRLESASNLEAPLANGHYNGQTGFEDAGLSNTAVESSDTEGSKIDSPEQGHLLMRHERANSIKKPMSFKAVSVTKNFLAKTAATPVKTVNEKPLANAPPASSAQAPLRPRLVAKTGKDARSMNATARAPGSGGPDASKVWNRNRPAPAPPQKQFTDEELKQQYGIHLATRLQADEAGKESKWADIDDEEDDWAPETVTWMDGTKSTILPTGNGPQLIQDLRPEPPPKADATEPETEETPVEQRSALAPVTGKTILRPGVRNSAPSLKPGLVLKGLPEKPIEPVQSMVSGPTKSPWASLPPVDKVSPVTFYPPASSKPIHRRTESEGQTPDSTADVAVASPTREIAADDFDRSWRDTEKGSRELFDSRSGRYEPVRGARRSSIRQDSGFRPPSLLQRPSQQSQSGHPEPSPAFQTRKSSVHESQLWGHHRSPSVTESRGSLERQLSLEKTSNPSQGHVDVSTSPQASRAVPAPGASSRRLSNALGTTTNHPSSEQKTYSARAPDGPSNAAGGQQAEYNADPRLEQQKLMRERIERNRQRKLEEEAKEEAAKQERIRQKLEALQASTPKPGRSEPSNDQMATGKTQVSQSPSLVETHMEKPLGQVYETESTVAEIDARSVPPVRDTNEIQAPPQALTQTRPAEHRLPHRSRDQSAQRGQATSVLDTESDQRGATEPVRPLSSASQWNGIAGPAHSSTKWASPGRNVWGPPSNDSRATLGNGAFDSSIQGLPPMQLSPQQNSSQRHTNGLPGAMLPPAMSPRATSPSAQGPPKPDMQALRRAWQAPPNAASREELVPLRQRSVMDTLEQDHSSSTFREPFVYGSDLDKKLPAVSIPNHVAGLGNVPQEQRNGSMNGTVGHLHAMQYPTYAGNNGKASRFFGASTDRTQQAANGRTFPQRSAIPRSPSPPPPDSWGHPVFGFRRSHPLVHLPGPSPKVRLPPATTSPSPQVDAVTMPTRLQTPRGGAQPIVNQLAWQDRFNGLFGRKQAPLISPQQIVAGSPAFPSPTDSMKSPVSVQPANVSSSSRPPLDLHLTGTSVTVSLPQAAGPPPTTKRNYALADSNMHSKPTEESLMDEREFGSSPTVNIPKTRYNSPLLLSQVRQKVSQGHPNIELQPLWTASVLPSGHIVDSGYSSSGIRVSISNSSKTLVRKLVPFKRAAGAAKPSKGPRIFEKRRKDGPSPGSGTSSVLVSSTQTANSEPERRPKSKWAKPSRGRGNGGAKMLPNQVSSKGQGQCTNL